MKRTGLLMAGAAAIITASPAQADGPYIGIEGGVSFKDRVDLDIDTQPADGRYEPAAIARTKMGLDADVILGYDFGAFRLEAEGGYKRNKYRDLTVLQPAVLQGRATATPGAVFENERDLEIWSGMVNALVELGPDDGFQVYGGGGAGIARFEMPIDIPNVGTILDDHETDFAWQLIGGVRFPLTDNLQLGAKYRYFVIDDFNLHGCDCSDLRANYRAHSALASLTYSFGGRSQPEPVEAPPPPPPVVAPPPPRPVPPPPPPQAVCNTGPYIVFFDFDRTEITPEAAGILNNAASAYANCGTARVMLAGHTDRAGSTQYNQGLAERRNAAVRSYLTARGVPSGQIAAQGFGESQPRVPTADGVREAQNRRVEVTYGPGSGM